MGINKVRTKDMLRAEVNNRSWPVYVRDMQIDTQR